MLSLEKKQELNLSKEVVLDLTKGAGIQGQIAKVVLCIDRSGSMSGLYSRGVVQKVIERLVPIAMAFDDDQSMEVYAFHSRGFKMTDVTLDNLEDYVKNNIEGRLDYGGTQYAPPIDMILRDYLSDTMNIISTKTTGGFLGFGKKTETTMVKVPTYVIFITDGENSDVRETTALVKEASNHGIFIQFVGISDDHSSFSFLKKLDTMDGRFIDNANFFEVTSEDLSNQDDRPLYNKLLAEFPQWVKDARKKSLIV